MNEKPAAQESLKVLLARTVDGDSLTRDEARQTMETILAGNATPAQIGGFLVALRLKGETVDEISGFVEAMRAAAIPVKPRRKDLVDLCGTGGDGSGTINISTAASLVVAAAGAGVAKHGNRSVSSRCGSADVLEALDVPIELEPAESAHRIDERGFAFLFAPKHHPAMRFAGPPRRELGIRTVFNILGPLSSPASVRRQLIGVFDDELRDVMAKVLKNLGSEHVWIVHAPLDGGGGMDEISVTGLTRVTALRNGVIETFVITPEDLGIKRASLDDLKGGDASQNAERIRAILAGESGPQRDAVLLNAGAALVVAGLAEDLPAGLTRAAEAVDSGRAREFLESLVRS